LAVQVEFDVQPASNSITIETLNPPNTKAAPSTSNQTVIAVIEDATTMPHLPLTEILKRLLPHIFTKPVSTISTNSRPNDNACGVLAKPCPLVKPCPFAPSP